MNTDSSRACRVLPGRAGATDPPVQVLHRAGCPVSGPYPCLQWMGEKVVSSRGAGGQEWAEHCQNNSSPAGTAEEDGSEEHWDGQCEFSIEICKAE